MMSPGNASSIVSRCWAKKKIGAATFIGFFSRTLNSRMPRLNLPEHSRTNAMRSRWLGSMLAWTLNTKPLTAFSCGSTMRVVVLRGSASGAHRARQSSSSVDAEILQRAAEDHRRQMALAETPSRRTAAGRSGTARGSPAPAARCAPRRPDAAIAPMLASGSVRPNASVRTLFRQQQSRIPRHRACRGNRRPCRPARSARSGRARARMKSRRAARADRAPRGRSC